MNLCVFVLAKVLLFLHQYTRKARNVGLFKSLNYFINKTLTNIKPIKIECFMLLN